jgi:predicted  nucleic acid-binding Zn-ribbon protein
MHEAMIPNELDSLRAELKNAQRERSLLTAQLVQMTTDRNFLRTELKHTNEIIAAARLKSALADDLQVEVASLREQLQLERAARAAIEQSRSWRLILKLRRLLDTVRSRR